MPQKSNEPPDSVVGDNPPPIAVTESANDTSQNPPAVGVESSAPPNNDEIAPSNDVPSEQVGDSSQNPPIIERVASSPAARAMPECEPRRSPRLKKIAQEKAAAAEAAAKVAAESKAAAAKAAAEAIAAEEEETAAAITQQFQRYTPCGNRALGRSGVPPKLVKPQKKWKNESDDEFKVRKENYKNKNIEELILQQAEYLLDLGELPKCPKMHGDTKGFCSCDCVKVFRGNVDVCVAVGRFCVDFWQRQKQEQDQTLMDWHKYARAAFDSPYGVMYLIPHALNGEEDKGNVEKLQNEKICTSTLCKIMNMSYKTHVRLKNEAMGSGLAKVHGNTGKRNRAYKDDSEEMIFLNQHMEELVGLSELTATKFTRELVEGKHVVTTRNDNQQIRYLPSCNSYRSCYDRYLNGTGHKVVKTRGDGSMDIRPMPDVPESSRKAYVSFWKYFYHWKTKYPFLKISKPAEDICQACFQFANRHKYHASQSTCTIIDEGIDTAAAADGIVVQDGIIGEVDEDPHNIIPSAIDNELFREGVVQDDSVSMRRSSRPRKPRNEKARHLEEDSEEESEEKGGLEKDEKAVVDGDEGCADPPQAEELPKPTPQNDVNAETSWKVVLSAESKSDEMKAMEEMLIRAGIHVEQAEVQRVNHNEFAAKAVEDAKNNVPHEKRTYAWTGDFGQNIMFPHFGSEQPGCTYYYSQLNMYNFGLVNHAHEYPDGPACHMDAHVYHEGIGKKGANTVASLFMKTMRQRGIIKEGKIGGHLVVSFDNCGGQNKNNTMMQLLMHMYEMRYFKKITFLFLIAGHTKNACDRLFNLLKLDYRQRNLYTLEELQDALKASPYVTVLPAQPEDFLDYTKFLRMFYSTLPNEINQNHVFQCGSMDEEEGCVAGSDFRITLYRSYREADVTGAVSPKRCRKKNWWINLTGRNYSSEDEASLKRVDDMKEMGGDREILKQLESPGLNPYKVVEMYSKFRVLLPLDKQNNELYREPTDEEWAVTKKEKQINKEKKINKDKMKRETMKMKREEREEVTEDDTGKAKKPRKSDEIVT